MPPQVLVLFNQSAFSRFVCSSRPFCDSQQVDMIYGWIDQENIALQVQPLKFFSWYFVSLLQGTERGCTHQSKRLPIHQFKTFFWRLLKTVNIIIIQNLLNFFNNKTSSQIRFSLFWNFGKSWPECVQWLHIKGISMHYNPLQSCTSTLWHFREKNSVTFLRICTWVPSDPWCFGLIHTLIMWACRNAPLIMRGL